MKLHESVKNKGKIRTFNELKDKFLLKHGNNYNYDKVVYKGNGDLIIINCPKHGDFNQTPNNHKRGQTCPKCSLELRKSQEKTLEDFRLVHGDRYDYSKVVYIKSRENVIITCREHGDFNQTPKNHMTGQNCPVCNPRGTFRNRNFFKDKKTILYYIKINDLYKVGLTTLSVKKRFDGNKIQYEILSQKEYLDGAEAFDKEQELLRESLENKYKGDNILSYGNSELRTKPIKGV